MSNNYLTMIIIKLIMQLNIFKEYKVNLLICKIENHNQ
jgi:hypothetical protein